MNYQQWKPLEDAPLGQTVAVNTGGYISPGLFWRRPDDALYCIGPYGKIYEREQIETWSWSATEPEAEMLMVKPHGIFCAHWWNEIGHLLNIIQENDIKLFVEIGVLDGGLASLLISAAEYSGMRYIGIDLQADIYVDKRVSKRAWNLIPQCAIIHGDVWDEKAVRMISNAVQKTEGRAMVYCDGGDKKREAALYWPTLRPGDLLGVHDYSDDPGAIGPEVYPADVIDILRAGRRLGQTALADTRILLVEKI